MSSGIYHDLSLRVARHIYYKKLELLLICEHMGSLCFGGLRAAPLFVFGLPPVFRGVPGTIFLGFNIVLLVLSVSVLYLVLVSGLSIRFSPFSVLPVSLYCTLLIATSVFSNIYLLHS